MTASGATGDTGATTANPGPTVPPVPVDGGVRAIPRLGRGIVWSDVVAEIERDREAADVRMRDAA
ncbi:DUF6222 family protein [Amycolatopsis vastitatis]|uniref:Uncharacterized protein n=1 Tax=Amycolatopsis vastitatis TaxID=1905142 RepID=A0A229SKR6_9PSEU|nr:DUF6222 family protein [Amycolatopsis vastitatis]OXM59370.1 hypothetical protein CF165_47850 [Amycolatopsis vastitatis]